MVWRRDIDEEFVVDGPEAFGAVVVVHPGLAGVQPGWWDPFDVAVGVDSRGPTSWPDHAVIRSARKPQLVDVGLSVVRPVSGGVVNLTAVGTQGAAGFRAPALPGDQHDSLRW